MEFNDIYRNELMGLDRIIFQETCSKGKSSYWFNCVLFEEDINVSELQKFLKEKGIPTRRVFKPLTDCGPYINYVSESCSKARSIYNKGLCLPSSTINNKDDINYVCKIIKELV